MGWSKPSIEKQKASIRAWIASLNVSPKQQLHEILREVKQLVNSSDEELQLRAFLLVVFALAHHLRHGGLSQRDIGWLGLLGDTLLRIRRIESSRSRVAFLFGDLHLMLSQIHWKEGKQWEASWEQLLAKTQEGGGGEASAGTYLALANRSLRLGQATNALTWIDKATTLGLEGWWANQAALKRLMIFRLQGEYTAAENFETKFLETGTPNEAEAREVAWEKKTRVAQQTGDLTDLVHSVRRKKEHHETEFAMEAFLWTRAVSSTKWMKQFPNFRKLVYSSQIKTKASDPLYRAVITIEQCYDSELSVLRRLRDLGEVLGELPSLINLNHELLVRAASLRWLTRVNAGDARALVACEYENLCRKLSDGKSDDVLNVVKNEKAGSVEKNEKAAA